MTSLRPLLLSRRPRIAGTDWSSAGSWFGGTPRLGALSWPRSDTSDEPLYFLAQIDLTALAAYLPPGLMPDSGSLAFFIDAHGTGSCRVIHVPSTATQNATLARTPPPTDARPVLVLGGDIFPTRPAPSTLTSFPYWPVDITLIDVSADAPEAEMATAVEKIAARRKFFLSAKQARQMQGDAPLPAWWHGAIHYAGCLANALNDAPGLIEMNEKWRQAALADVERLQPKGLGKVSSTIFGKAENPDLDQARKNAARLEAKQAKMLEDLPKLQTFVKDVSAFSSGRRPAGIMSPRDAEEFEAMFKRGRSEFEEFARYRTPFDLDELLTASLLAMLTGDDVAYQTIPEPVRDGINEQYLLPAGSWHQMFGRGVDIQGSAVHDNESNIMLLQLVYDDMINWRFGDVGAYQFWISPEDLRARNWSGVRTTFECH